MTLRLYNTLTRSLQPFEPLHPPAVTMYVCGPTVYDVPHIGHARSAYIFDVLRHYLAYRKHQLTFVRNVTDVDDKIIEKARQEPGNASLTEKCQAVAQRYLTAYHETMDQLGIARPDIEPKATEHVLPDEKHIDASMTGFIAQLLVKGAAYEAGGPACRAPECKAVHGTGRDVYFSVRKFPGYGTLSNRSIDELQSGARVEPGEHKQDPLDFALWKTAKPDEPSWNSPWGKGRPGWHIECSVMSTRYLGDTFDIHGGGVDLVFPHHENEIAQVQALGKPFAKYWIHNGLLTVKGEKMSKSLGNYITVEAALKSAFQKPDALKTFFLGTHYRSPIDYTEENILAANRRLIGWVSFLDWAENYRKGFDQRNIEPETVAKLRVEFMSAMDDDMNTAVALSVLDRLVTLGRQAEKKLFLTQRRPGEISLVTFGRPGETSSIKNELIGAADAIRDLGSKVFGLFSKNSAEQVPEKVKTLVDEREMARQRQDFKQADVLRKQIEDAGFLVADTSGGPVIRPKRT